MNAPIMITEEIKQGLRAAGEEVDAQRLALLRGRRFLFVMGSYPGKRLMYEHAREAGVSMVVLDGPGHWSKDAVGEGLFEGFIEVDLFPTETVAERAFAAIQATGLQFDGVATFEDNAGPLAALLAEALGLPGHSPLSVGFSKNKIFTREVCVEAGILSPRFFRIRSLDDLEAAAAHVGFPSVLKPVSGSSSFATYFITDKDMLCRRYERTISESTGHLKTSGVHSDDETELIWAKGFDMTLEEFLGGEEFDVDVLLSEGETVYAEVTRDVMDARLSGTRPNLAVESGGLPQPSLREAGSQMPAEYPAEKQAEMIDFAITVLHALEFTDGAFHVELKYTSEGPRLIEVNARIGGGPIYYFHRHVWGVDLVEGYLLTRLGVPIRPRKAPQPLTCLLTSDLPSPRTGIVTHADFLQPIENHPQLIHAKPKVSAGQKVVGPDTGVPDWLGEIMVFGPTVKAASQAMDEILSQLVFPIESQEAEPG
jgi:biotin carboxylase